MLLGPSTPASASLNQHIRCIALTTSLTIPTVPALAGNALKGWDKCVTIRCFPSYALPLTSTDGWLKKNQFLSHIGQSSCDWWQVYISSQSWVLTQGKSGSDQLPHQLSQKSQGAHNYDQQQRSLLRLCFFLQESWLLRPSSESPWQYLTGLPGQSQWGCKALLCSLLQGWIELEVSTENCPESKEAEWDTLVGCNQPWRIIPSSGTLGCREQCYPQPVERLLEDLQNAWQANCLSPYSHAWSWGACAWLNP